MMVGAETRVADLVPLRESHPWVHDEVGQVLKRARIEAAPSTHLPDPKADVVEPDPLGEVPPLEELGVAVPEPGEQGQIRGRDGT